MIDVPTDLRCEISGLQWLDLQQLKSRYADILQDGQKCERIELLRSVIAYRLQERFYGERLGKSMMELLNNAVKGESLAHSPADRKQDAVKEKIRTYIKDGVLNRYTKEKKATKRPAQEDQINFCSEHYQVTNFSVLEKGRDELILKSSTAPIYVVLVEGTYLKWESALRKGLLYVAGHPLGKNKANTVHIVLSLYVGGEAITPADKKLLQNALERAGADAYLWGN